MWLTLLGSVWGSALGAPIAFVGATVHPVDGPALPDAVLVVDEGRIVSLGVGLTVPETAEKVDVTGQHIIPGLIDIHSHIGGGDLHEALSPLQPGVSAVDAVDPTHISLDRARAGGITTVNVMPGSGQLLGGQTAYLSLRQSTVLDDLLLCVDDDTGVWSPASAFDAAEPDAPPARHSRICGGIKMANGTNPQGGGGNPATRMGVAFLQRDTWLDALERSEQAARARAWSKASWWERRSLSETEAPSPDPALDVLVQGIEGRRVIHFHSHRADDIVTALRLKEEMGPRFSLVIHHGSEGFKVAQLLADSKIPVAINVLDTPGGKEETVERTLSNAAVVADAGVSVAIITDDPVQDSRLLLRSAALAVRGGLSPDLALRGLTATPAELLGMADQTGTLTIGKEADFVVLSGNPFSVWTHVVQTWVDGEKVFDRNTPSGLRAAQGGDAVATQGDPP